MIRVFAPGRVPRNSCLCTARTSFSRKRVNSRRQPPSIWLAVSLVSDSSLACTLANSATDDGASNSLSRVPPACKILPGTLGTPECYFELASTLWRETQGSMHARARSYRRWPHGGRLLESPSQTSAFCGSAWQEALCDACQPISRLDRVERRLCNRHHLCHTYITQCVIVPC